MLCIVANVWRSFLVTSYVHASCLASLVASSGQGKGHSVRMQWKFSECFSMQFCIFNLEPMAWFANCRVCRLTHAVRPAHQSPKSMWSQCAYEAHLKASNAQKRDQKFKLILLDLELPSWKSFQAKVSLANFWFWSSRAKGFWIRTSDRATEESQKF